MSLRLQIKKEDPKTLRVLWEEEVWREVAKSLFFNELRKFPSDLTREDFLARFAGLEKKIGQRYSVYLLSKRNLLSTELEAKLLSKGLSTQSAKEAVQRCVEKGFLDDAAEMRRLVDKYLRKGLSAKAVFYKLKAKPGMDEALLKKHLLENPPSDADVLQQWLKKNAHKIDRNDRDEVRKLMAKLARKGFSYELIAPLFRDF
jgi:SOS response regulatory protein OraA/RecX